MRWHRSALFVLPLLPAVCGAEPGPVLGPVREISVATSGVRANASVACPALSADGRAVAFVSDATNLVPGDTNGTFDVFVRDLDTNTTERVSVANDGAQGGGFCPVSMSADGTLVAFDAADAAALVPGDGNGITDTFVHDRSTGTTRRVSVHSDGSQGIAGQEIPGNWPREHGSWGAVLSDDGRFVAFISSARGLIDADTNDATDIFVHDLTTQTTTRVSTSAMGAQANNASGFGPDIALERIGGVVRPRLDISADGRRVLFASRATNLIAGVTERDWHWYVKDLDGGAITRVYTLRPYDPYRDNTGALNVRISGDGGSMVFESDDESLVAGDRVWSSDVFFRDLSRPDHQLVTAGTDGGFSSLIGAEVMTFKPELSHDGRFVAFASNARGLSRPFPRDELTRFYVRDMHAGRTWRVFDGTSGQVSGDSQISADGSRVVFSQLDGNIVRLFVRDVSGYPSSLGFDDGFEPVVPDAGVVLSVRAQFAVGPVDVVSDGTPLSAIWGSSYVSRTGQPCAPTRGPAFWMEQGPVSASGNVAFVASGAPGERVVLGLQCSGLNGRTIDAEFSFRISDGG